MTEEFDLISIIKRVRLLTMLTDALFAERDAMAISFADQFEIREDETD